MRLKAEDLERREFLQMPKWLYELKGLKSIDREIYMLGYNNWRLSEKNNWVNENGEIYFLLAITTLEEKTGETRKSIIASLKTLVEVGVFEAEKSTGKATKYFLVEMSKNETSKKVIKRAKSEIKRRKVDKTSSDFDTSLTSSDFDTTTSSDFDTTTSSDFDTIVRTTSKNKEIRTTTKKEPEKSSSSLEIYLKEKGYDSKTISNITRLNLTLERVKEVVEYADKINMGIGYIVDALKNNYEVQKKQVKKEPTGRRSSAVLGEKDLEYSMSSEEKEHKRLESEVYKIVKGSKLSQDFFKATLNLKTLKEFIEKHNLKVS